jgi:hypothetical protein
LLASPVSRPSASWLNVIWLPKLVEADVMVKLTKLTG